MQIENIISFRYKNISKERGIRNMKSKIQKNQVLLKKKGVIISIALIVITSVLGITLLSSFKNENILKVGASKEELSGTRYISIDDLGTASNPLITNESVVIHGNNILKVSIKKKNSAGQYVNYTVGTENYTFIFGDVNNDNKVDYNDATEIWKYKAGETNFSDWQKIVADINGDGIIDKEDIFIILYGTSWGDGTLLEDGQLIGNPIKENDSGYSYGYMYIKATDARVALRISANLGDDKLTSNQIEEMEGNIDLTGTWEEREKKVEQAMTILMDDSTSSQGIYDAYKKMLCDVNMDFKVTVEDARTMLRIAARLEGASNVGIPIASTYKEKWNNLVLSIPEIVEDGEYAIVIEKNDGTTETKYFTIDTKSPSVNGNFELSTNGPTNKNVTVTIKFDEPVKKAGDSDYNSTQTVTMTDNGTISITFYDKAENEISVPITVNNIDRTAPRVSVKVGNSSAITNDKVQLTITAIDDESGVSNIYVSSTELTFNTETISGTGTKISTATFDIKNNGNYTIQVRDHAGNIINTVAEVSNIDKTAPVATVAYSTTDYTNKDVTATVYFNEPVTITKITNYEYKNGNWDDKEFTNNEFITTYTTTFTENLKRTIEFKDEAGNTGSVNAEVKNINRVAPPEAQVTQTPTDATNGKVTLNIKCNVEDKNGNEVVVGDLEYIKVNGAIILSIPQDNPDTEINERNEAKKEAVSGVDYIVTENGQYTIEAIDFYGNVSTTKYEVTNIDKSYPEISVTANTVEPAQSVELTIIAQDTNAEGDRTYITDTKDTEDNAGNLNSIILKKTGESEKFIQGGREDENNSHHVKYTINENGIYEVIATDAAGNRSRETITITNIDTTVPKYNLTYSPKSKTNQNVEAYINFDEPVAVSEDNNNWSAYSDQHIEVFTENSEKSLYYKDKAGNIKTKTIKNEENEDIKVAVPLELKVDWIDKDAPTVNITAKKVAGTTESGIINNITNADKIKYTFTWSEKVEGFTADDITVNNGTKEKLSEASKNSDGTYSYTMDVTTSIQKGNIGDIVLTIPAGACTDGAQGNIEQQKIITVDKKAPTLTSYNIKKSNDGTQIILETIFDEAIGTVSTSDIEVKFGENLTNGNGAVTNATTIDTDKRIVTYTYNISGADEGTPTITLNANTVKDIAGNGNSSAYTLENKDIVLEKHVIKIGNNEYSFSKNDTVITNFANPTYFKAGDTIKVIKNSTSEYKYTVVAGQYGDNTYMQYMTLTEPAAGQTVGTASFSTNSGNINISEANIYFDTVAPTLNLLTNIEAVENNVYTNGKEIILISTTSEPITNKDTIPGINISFSKSGLGKYNYQGENTTTGNAKYIETIKNDNGTTSWKYKYIVEQGDEGSLRAEYVSGNLIDYAGNETDIVDLYAPTNPSNGYSEIKEFNSVQIRSIKFYKNSNYTEEINPISNSNQVGDLYIKVELTGPLYTGINTKINKTTAPHLYLNDDIKTTTQDVSSDGKTLKYKYSKDTVNSLTKVEYITIKNENTTLYTQEDLIGNPSGIAVNNKYTENIADFYLDPIGVSNSMDLSDICVDTIVPTVNITAKKVEGTTNVSNNITNADTLEYTFTWSEEVTGFTAEDITVNNGTKVTTLLEASQNPDGTYSYTMNITSSVETGNVGDIQVIVEKGACQDIVGHENVRTESVIRVDKQAPILIGLEAYASSSISVSQNVDSVKEYYKVGDTVTIVATFSENIENSNLPTLALQFSESGNAKGNVSAGTKSGNKITYTYSITDGDNGRLSVKGFSGTVLDSAGNETKVTKRNLDGDTIMADTVATNLVKLNVKEPDAGTYKAGNVITIEAIYNEEIYVLNNNEVNNMTTDMAPTLKIKFGNGEERITSVLGYGEKENGSVDRTKIIYTYTIADGDNGAIDITSYENKDNVTVCDIAGNAAELYINQTGNEIIADTTRPQVTNITAIVENPSISNTGIYYKEGNKIKIALTFNEEVSSAVINPVILVGFSEESEIEPTTYTTYAYESDWNVNSQTIEYSYIIQSGNNGYLWVKVPEGQFKDIAGNTNTSRTGSEISNVFADTTAPSVTLSRDTSVEQNNQIITITARFSENVYDLNDNSRVGLTKENAPKLIYSFGVGSNKEVGASSVNGNTIIYRIEKDSVNDNGTLLYELAKGNLCDRAGNLYYTDTTDTTAPILENVVISTNAGMYDPYCKAGTEIYVTATFNEPIADKNIKLKAKIGDIETEELEGGIVAENPKQIKFTYKVKAGDIGEFTIIDICGEIDNQITGENADNTYGWVRDEKGNQNNIYSLADEGIIPTGEAEADTKDPYITSIKAKVNNEEIATYTKEEGNDAVITVGRTNANIVEYLVTYSEEIPYNHFDRLNVTNGVIKDVQYTSNNEYKITVQTTVEGVQSLIVPEGTVEDKAGNTDKFVKLDAVTVDFTKPTVRFISEYNGGIYVLPTNIGKVEIRPNVEISEDIAKIEYKWDDGEYVEIENYSSSSDIAVPTRTFREEGEYVLSIRVKDLAGNVAETSKTYRVINSDINIDLSTFEYTNQDITTTVSFGEGLTDNRKVTFKAEGSNEIIELNATGINEDGTEYTIKTNGIIYAEATDKVGNKVFTEYTIINIDKQAPIVKLEINGANLVIGTGKDKATIKTRVEVEDVNLEDIKFIYSENETLTEEEKDAMENINNYAEATTTDALEGTYYLYVLATDSAGNETMYKSSEFKVANSNILIDEDGDIRFLPADEDTIKFERQQQFIYVTYGSTLTEEQNITFTNEDDGYVYDNYVEVLKSTTVTATAADVCGNTVIATYVVESIEGPEFEVIGNPTEWTNQDVKLEVSTYDALKELRVNGEDILSKEENINSNIVVSENGDYEFIATDIYGNISNKTIKVTKIDKGLPVISEVENEGKDITITATDELSGVAEYAITSTTETPVEWSESNVIKTTKDGTFYVWAKDNAGNVRRSEDIIVIDTTAPTIIFNYTALTSTVGTPIGATITTNEDTKISYSWDNKTWVTSEDYVRSQGVETTPSAEGIYTLYAKAIDRASNQSAVQTIKFNVVKELNKVPEIIFEDLPTIQVDGVKYVKISADMTTENLTNKMDKNELLGETPEYTKLTSDNRLKTGSEITIDSETKYIIVVNGDVNCDGKVTFLGDVVMANNYRIGQINLSVIQKLAADINNSGTIDFIPDIVAMNNYRLGIINSL